MTNISEITRQGGTIKHGRVYWPLPAGMQAAPQNRMICPRCERAVSRYTYLWANQCGYETRYFCDCSLWFHVRYDTSGAWFACITWKGARDQPKQSPVKQTTDDLPF